jgi:hypothetical protein
MVIKLGRPTLRKSGYKMYIVKVPMHIGKDDLIFAACYNKEILGNGWPTSRMNWIEILMDLYGSGICIRDGWTDDMDERDLNHVSNLCGIYFPELCIRIGGNNGSVSLTRSIKE